MSSKPLGSQPSVILIKNLYEPYYTRSSSRSLRFSMVCFFWSLCSRRLISSVSLMGKIPTLVSSILMCTALAATYFCGRPAREPGQGRSAAPACTGGWTCRLRTAFPGRSHVDAGWAPTLASYQVRSVDRTCLAEPSIRGERVWISLSAPVTEPAVALQGLQPFWTEAIPCFQRRDYPFVTIIKGVCTPSQNRLQLDFDIISRVLL